MKKPTRWILLFFSPVILYSQVNTISWSNFSNSPNMFCPVLSSSKPLQYNDELNVVSWIQRTPPSYTTSPLASSSASSGLAVAFISSNWGSTWDSTCIWSNNSNWARYPQGAVYNPSGNTNINNAQVVGSGPGYNGSWTGNWYASKPLISFNNSASTAPNAMQFFSGANAATAENFCSFSCYSFSSTDDGHMRSLAEYGFDPATQSSLNTGATVITGTFNTTTNAFDWRGDSIICPAVIGTNGKSMYARPRMAWNEAGTVGYVMFLGSRQWATGSNVGWQPIIYKTLNSGATWSLMPSIDFNSTGAAQLKHHLPAVNNSTAANALVIPFFNADEGVDVIVDKNDKLHIAGLIYSSLKSHVDSINLHTGFVSSVDNETYTWRHTPGKRPYLYDFIVSGDSTWLYGIVDSLPTEAPGTSLSQNGFAYNPWDIDPGTSTKLPVEARVQLSRTPDGRYVAFTWAESDTNITTGGVKWNLNPNIKARLLDASTYQLNDAEMNLTDYFPNPNPNVRGFAYMHYTSPRCSDATTTTAFIELKLPVTVSNNPFFHGAETCNNWYAAAGLVFPVMMHAFTSTIGSIVPVATTTVTGIAETNNEIQGITVYPNPVKDHLHIDTGTQLLLGCSLIIQNAIGQLVYKIDNFQTKEIDLSALSPGIYLLKFKTAVAQKAVKLVKE